MTKTRTLVEMCEYHMALGDAVLPRWVRTLAEHVRQERQEDARCLSDLLAEEDDRPLMEETIQRITERLAVYDRYLAWAEARLHAPKRPVKPEESL